MRRYTIKEKRPGDRDLDWSQIAASGTVVLSAAIVLPAAKLREYAIFFPHAVEVGFEYQGGDYSTTHIIPLW